MMMVLGLYVFMLRTVPYQELQYQRSWRHAANSRVNRRPSTQFLGPENDMLTLSVVAGTGADGRTGESMAPD